MMHTKLNLQILKMCIPQALEQSMKKPMASIGSVSSLNSPQYLFLDHFHTTGCTCVLRIMGKTLFHSGKVCINGWMCQSMTLHTGFCISPINSDQLQSLAEYSDVLCIGLHRLCNIALPLVSVPPHMPPLCLFVCLFTFVPQCHMLLALFVNGGDCIHAAIAQCGSFDNSKNYEASFVWV